MRLQRFLEAARLASVPIISGLSAAPATISTLTLLILLLAFAAIVAIYAAVRFRRHIKIIAVVILAVAIVAAGFAVAWYSEAAINYWFVAAQTTAATDNPVTMYCENQGHLAGTFDLELQLTNAHISQKTSLPYTLIDDRTAKFTFTLQPGDTENRTAWFIIDNYGNVTDFYIYLSFQQNDGNFLVRSSSGGVDTASYQKDVTDQNFTMRTFAPPP